ncbi:TniQ family protein [Paenibacillus sp. 19GGS1-52]|uniref:TniQ family protein n=1 Tax=Paenibacillus sp. 19GGS1-52 TaxID=2758563 RepID=UPI001EFBCC80|nr:TniQ family protein [Paenibacillus sp. 19GGS1-52]
MMNRDFKICIQPKSGESLTSFILKMTYLNGCEAQDVWKKIGCSNEEARSHIKFSRFDYDLHIFDREKMALLLGVAIAELDDMTSMKLYSKFFSDPYQDFDTAATMLRDVLQTNVRRICPLCVKEKNVFELIWQIKEVDICPIHEVKLKSECSHCRKKINHSDNILVDPFCSNQCCNNSLLDDYEKVPVDDDVYRKQKQYFDEWRFLLFDNKVLACEQNGLSMEQNLAIKLLYIAQGQQQIYCRKKVSHLSMNIIKTLILLIKSNRVVKRVRVQEVLHVLRAVGLSVEEFACIEVPSKYLNSIIKQQKVFLSSECLAPWCHNHKKKNIKMHLSKERIESRNREEKVRYPYYYTCLNCFMKYGYHPITNQWDEIHGQINMILKISQMASEGRTRSQVASKLRKNLFYVSEVFGYLAYRKLLPERISQLFKSELEVINGDVIDYFKTVDIDWRRYPEFRYKNLKEKYGWSLATYSYYYADTEVQKYLINKPSNLRKPLKKYTKINEVVEMGLVNLVDSEINISIEQVAATLNVSEATLRRHGQVQVIRQQIELQLSAHLNKQERRLRELFDHELVKRREMEALFHFKDVYKVLKHGREYIAYRFPGLFNYIIRIIKDYDEFLAQVQETNKRLQIRSVVRDTFTIYSKLNVSLVARRLGVQYIHVVGYKRLKDMIIEEIEIFQKNTEV